MKIKRHFLGLEVMGFRSDKNQTTIVISVTKKMYKYTNIQIFNKSSVNKVSLISVNEGVIIL